MSLPLAHAVVAGINAAYTPEAAPTKLDLFVEMVEEMAMCLTSEAELDDSAHKARLAEMLVDFHESFVLLDELKNRRQQEAASHAPAAT